MAPKLAAQNGVKLVFYGENEAEFGNPREENLTATRDFRFYSSGDLDKIFLGGVSIADLKDKLGLEDVDFKPYLPSDPDKLAEAEIEVH